LRRLRAGFAPALDHYALPEVAHRAMEVGVQRGVGAMIVARCGMMWPQASHFWE